MKCYRCGEESPDPVTRYEDVDEAKAEALKANEEALVAAEDAKEAWAKVDELRAELRRYEPSDALMYQMFEKRTVINEAAEIIEIAISGMSFETQQAKARAWLERHRNGWHAKERPIPEPEATIRALHTVIDEGRQLFDYAWDEHDNTNEIGGETWARIDEWRQRVLVKEARETVSGEITKFTAVIDNCDELDEMRVAHIKNLEAERTSLIESCKCMAERQYYCPKCDQQAPDRLAAAHAALVDANCRLAAENATLRLELGKVRTDDD